MEIDLDARAAATDTRCEAHHARVFYRRPGQRAPAKLLRWNIADDFRVPFDAPAKRRMHAPVRARCIDHAYFIDMLHEAGEISDIAPEVIAILW